jgi:SAM-dependent methyltransferase
VLFSQAGIGCRWIFVPAVPHRVSHRARSPPALSWRSLAMSVLRTVVDATTLSLGRMKRRKRHRVNQEGMVKINLGCGLAVAKGWVNVDGSLNALVANMPGFMHRVAYRLTGANKYYKEAEYRSLLGDHRFIHHDLSFGIPVADGVADYAYSSHFLEHMPRRQAEHLLNEMHRVLKVGGVARIAVPDLEYAVGLYAAGQKEKMLNQYFFIDVDESYYARHKYMYDFQMLKDALIRAGFREVRRCSFAEGEVPDIDVLDRYPEDSLFVEAKK